MKADQFYYIETDFKSIYYNPSLNCPQCNYHFLFLLQTRKIVINLTKTRYLFNRYKKYVVSTNSCLSF